MIKAKVDMSEFPFVVYIYRGKSKEYSVVLEVEGSGKLSTGGSRRERQVARLALHEAGVQGF